MAQHSAPTSPPVVAILRGVGLMTAEGAVLALITALSDLRGGQMALIAAMLIPGLRVVEGFIDKALGQAEQAGLRGGRPADPTAYVQDPPPIPPPINPPR